MSTETTEQAQTSAEQESTESLKKLAEKASSAFRSVWLAVLGVPSAAMEGGSQFFHHLVEKGEKAETQGKEHLKSVGQSAGRAVETMTTTVDEAIRDIRVKARGFAGKSEELIDQKITDKLKAMGVPTEEDIQSLSQRVDQIAAKLEKIREPQDETEA